MKISSLIARRYLFAKKSLGVINIISIISAAGIAVGCAALVIILSVYNGFEELVLSLNDSHTADVVIEPSYGKTFQMDGRFDSIRENDAVKALCEIVEESVFVKYGDRNAIVTARGVDSLYESVTGLNDFIVEGEFDLTFGSLNQVVAGRTIAAQLGARTTFITPLELYFPSRGEKIDLLNPLSSLRSENLYLGGIVSLDQSFDQKYIFMPVSTLRSLLEYGPEEVSSVEIYLDSKGLDANGMARKELMKEFVDTLGDDFVIKDRQQQNSMMYKLMLYEKVAIYLILLFVIIIISCNIFSSLSMLIIEKRDDIETLKSIGADDSLIRKIFVNEGWLISILGIVTGVSAGLLICFLQQRFGLVKMPGNFVVEAYPVVVEWGDIVLTFISVSVVGFLASALSRKLTSE